MKKLINLSTLIITILCITMDGNAQWIQTNGPFSTVVNCLASSGSNILAGTNGHIFISSDNGANWTKLSPDLGQEPFVFTLVINDSNFIAGGYFGVAVSSDYGGTWTTSTDGLLYKIDQNHYDTYIVKAIRYTNSQLIAGTEVGLFISTDKGKHWDPVITSLPIIDVRALEKIDTNLFAGTEFGVFLSTDNGASWKEVNIGLTHKRVRSFAVLGTYIFVGTFDGGVFRSINNGENWVQLDSSLGKYSVDALAVSNTYIFASNYGGGIFVSSDSGSTWSEVSTGLTEKFIKALTTSSSYIYTGLWSSGVWRRPLSEMINTKSVQSLSASNISSTAYPNPFTTSTTISYTLPKHDLVTIEVFDILGRKIQTLANEVMDAGPHSVVFNGENLPLGMYTVRITSGASSEEMKVVLSK